MIGVTLIRRLFLLLPCLRLAPRLSPPPVKSRERWAMAFADAHITLFRLMVVTGQW
jgi:hypothetical protein